MTLTKHCHTTGNWIQQKLKIGPSKISVGLYLQLKRRIGPQ